MADKKSKDETRKPAAAEAPQGAQQAQPGLQIVTQFVKDCSVDLPNAPETLVTGWGAPETNINISLGHKQLKDNLFEVALNLRVEAKNAKENKTAFIIDLHYGALVALQNIPAENTVPVLAVEVPKLLFPFAREIIADLTVKAGFPPLYMAPISFEALYVNEMKRLQEAQGKKAGNA